MQTITEFLGWSTLINVGLLITATIAIVAMRDFIAKIHSKFFGMATSDVTSEYFRFLANYKILMLVFNFVPYLVLKLITK